MDLNRPLRVVTPTLDGDVLGVLAGGDSAMTVLEVQRLAGRGSKPGVRRVLKRLVREGIVLEVQAGPVFTYQLNQDHIAARWIEGLAAMRVQLLDRLRAAIADWEVEPVAALLFGSAARGGGDVESDLDVLVIRPARSASDESRWLEQRHWLAQDISASSGNDVRLLEFGEEELPGLAGREPVLDDVLREGIDLTPGAGRKLRRLLRDAG